MAKKSKGKGKPGAKVLGWGKIRHLSNKEKFKWYQKRIEKLQKQLTEAHNDLVSVGRKPRGKVGNPSTYNPKYDHEVIVHMSEGFSLTAACGLMGVRPKKADKWKDRHPSFKRAIEMGKVLRTAFFEQRLMSAQDGPLVTKNIFTLKNAAPEEWKDRQEVDNLSSDGSMKPRKINLVARLQAERAEAKASGG